MTDGTVPYIYRFPVGHEHEGKPAGRNSKCSRCGEPFPQYRINPEWVAAIRQNIGVAAAESFKGSCEITPDGKIYQPPFCISCTRKIRS